MDNRRGPAEFRPGNKSLLSDTESAKKPSAVWTLARAGDEGQGRRRNQQAQPGRLARAVPGILVTSSIKDVVTCISPAGPSSNARDCTLC